MTHPSADPRTHPGYQEIVDRLRADIATGQRRPGDRLPPVRELARSLGVNVNTVARAYAELARDGAIVSRRGGGSFVAAQADDVVNVERRTDHLRALVGETVLQTLSLGYTPAQIEAAVQGQLTRWSAATRFTVGPARRQAETGRLAFVGSHDLALELLAARLRRQVPPVELNMRFAGSLTGLMSLLLGEAQIAGCHLFDEESGEYNAPHARRLLPGHRLLMVTVARRQQGFIVPRGNPRGIRSAADLGQPGLVLANRQPGSGTRMLVDRELRRARLDPTAFEQQIYPTHAAVAAAVADGTADVGIGILAAARTYGLDLVPIDWEPYELVIPQQLVGESTVQSLLLVLESAEFRSVVRELGGYDTEPTGERRWVSEIPDA